MRRPRVAVLVLGLTFPSGLLPFPRVSEALPQPDSALELGGTDAYVSFGDSPALHLPQFTLELWFRREGPGVPASTGSDGLEAIPLVSKGRGEDDGSDRDMNFFLGIRSADGVIAADFEEGASGSPPGLNHPIWGTTPVGVGAWHHAAAAYDGGTWRLYLDGALEAERVVGRPVQSESIQHAALGSALNSLGVPSGYFDGVLDEVRIWNYARTRAQIQSTLNVALVDPEPGLVARWSLDDAAPGQIAGSAGSSLGGTLIGVNYAWTSGAPKNLNAPPSMPSALYPADGSVGVGTNANLEVAAGDPDGQSLNATYYGREAPYLVPGPDFSIVLLPDTQYYSAQMWGATPQIFRAQVDWIVANRESRNIVFAGQLGDCVDVGNSQWQWENANYAVLPLENPLTGLPWGIPFSIAVGNHDQTPFGDASGSTDLYNQFFGTGRFFGRSYYGGHFGANNDNHYSLFSASGIDFLELCLEYNPSPDPAVLSWARQVLAAYPRRKAIVISHWLIGPGNPGNLAPPGQAVLNALKDSPNLLLMACGHVDSEGRRSDVLGERTVYTFLSDYQWRSTGGDGWLRILTFSPSRNELHVQTYSPTLDRFEVDEDSDFTLPVDLTPESPWSDLATVYVGPGGGTAAVTWYNRRPRTWYEWKVRLTDGSLSTESPVYRFQTDGPDGTPPQVAAMFPAYGEHLLLGTFATLRWNAIDNEAVASVDLSLIREETGVPEEIATGIPNSGEFIWRVTAPITTAGRLRVVVRDAAGNSAETLSSRFEIGATVTGAEPEVPARVVLGAVWPNPVHGYASIAYSLPEETRVRLSILDVAGREVAVLESGLQSAGYHEPVWRPESASGRLASGVYFVHLMAGGESFSRKILVLR